MTTIAVAIVEREISTYMEKICIEKKLASKNYKRLKAKTFAIKKLEER